LLALSLAAVPVWGVDFAQSIPATCEQAVLVVAPGWSSTTGTLQRFTRTGAHSRWSAVAEPVPVLLGKRGFAWGVGLHPLLHGDTPQKTEGDLRSPAGIFSLGPAFGHTSADKMAWLRMPYQPLSPNSEAVDDSNSRFYNRIVDRQHIERPDWRSSEHMWQVPDYELGLVVGHNPEHRPGAGSCIFIHLWLKDRSGTAGCTALHRADLVELMRWLDPAKHPVFVQMPAELVRDGRSGF
jgi:D-alanyl-D-alanine dipeptidase